jgi:hypothetical protein
MVTMSFHNKKIVNEFLFETRRREKDSKKSTDRQHGNEIDKTFQS